MRTNCNKCIVDKMENNHIGSKTFALKENLCETISSEVTSEVKIPMKYIGCKICWWAPITKSIPKLSYEMHPNAITKSYPLLIIKPEWIKKK